MKSETRHRSFLPSARRCKVTLLVFSRRLDHVRGVGSRSAARRQPHLAARRCSTGRSCRSMATAPVTTCGLPVAVSGAFDPSDEDRHADWSSAALARATTGTPALNSRHLRRVAQPGPRGRRRRGRHLAARPRRPARRPRGDDPLGGHGGFRGRLSRRRRAARPLRHRRAGVHHRRRLADLRPDAASHPLAPRHGGGARCRQRLHLRPGACRDRRAAAGVARTARRLRPAACPGDPADGGAYRPAAHDLGDRPAHRRHRPRAGDRSSASRSARRRAPTISGCGSTRRGGWSSTRRCGMAEIAARTGFSSAASFSRAFSHAFGQAPTRMRSG